MHSDTTPRAGDIAQVRRRQYLPPQASLGTLSALDKPRRFVAYLHALKWSIVTATDARLFQPSSGCGLSMSEPNLSSFIGAVAELLRGDDKRHLICVLEAAVRKVAVSLLGVVLVSCSTAHSSIPAEGRELSQFVLVMREHPDGQVSFAWHRAEEFDLERYRQPSFPVGVDGRIVRAAARPRDCHAEYLECIDECMSRPLPRGYGHITAGRGLGGKMEYCQGRCRQPYNDCEELQRLKPQEFSAWDGAVDWLKRHRSSLLVGSVIVIAGVTFVVVSAGAGLVVLAPVVLLAAAGAGEEPHGVGGAR